MNTELDGVVYEGSIEQQVTEKVINALLVGPDDPPQQSEVGFLQRVGVAEALTVYGRGSFTELMLGRDLARS